MKIRGIDFGPVWGASGVQGFFGEGYWYHHLAKLVGLNFSGMTFVAKTTTLDPWPGNMSLLNDGITPRDWFPACVVVKPRQGIALNSVGLSGPGVQALLDAGRWQQRKEPFFISFMSVAKPVEERLRELGYFVELLKARLVEFAPGMLGLQWNVTCPNVGVHSEDLVREVIAGLDILATLGIPILVKLSVMVAVSTAYEISRHEACDGIVISNTIPWKHVDTDIKRRIFGSETSPLDHLGGGGLSGRPLLPLVRQWVIDLRATGMNKHINAGGGILRPADVRLLFDAGANSVFLGTVAMVRPWRVAGCIKEAYKCSKNRSA